MRPPPANSLTDLSSGRPCRSRTMSRTARRPGRRGAHRIIGTALELGVGERPGPTRYRTRSARRCLPVPARQWTLEESPDPVPARCRRAVAARLEPPLNIQNHPNGVGVSLHDLDDQVPPDAAGRSARRPARRTSSPDTVDRATSAAHHEFDTAGTPSTRASVSRRAHRPCTRHDTTPHPANPSVWTQQVMTVHRRPWLSSNCPVRTSISAGPPPARPHSTRRRVQTPWAV